MTELAARAVQQARRPAAELFPRLFRARMRAWRVVATGAPTMVRPERSWDGQADEFHRPPERAEPRSELLLCAGAQPPRVPGASEAAVADDEQPGAPLP